jgi:predicted DsbA family dithiol-disulfide isomerase
LPEQGIAVNIEIWSDIACPWCFIGKRRFEAALRQFEHADEVTVTWRSFELDPSAPAERPGDHTAHLAAKYGTSVEQARAMHDRMTETAAADGLAYRFDLVRSGNTFDAHRLTHLAAARGKQDELEERLMKAYLEEGELMSDHATLRRLAADVGLPADEVAELLATDQHADAVRADEVTAHRLGITAVPFFVADRAIGAAGAQPVEVLLGFLREAYERSRPAIPVVVTGEACGPEGC